MYVSGKHDDAMYTHYAGRMFSNEKICGFIYEY